VQGSARGEYTVRACLAAAGDSAAEAQAVLDQISLSVRDGRATVEGPADGNWIGFLLVESPSGAVLDLGTTNGPISLNAITASVQAHSTNGPISLFDVSGQVRARAQNGPISLSGSKGEFHLEAQNGPIWIELLGSRWESGELEASTQNGPLTLTLPESYQSSVRVEASRHSPFECRAIQCKQAVRTVDRPNLVEFGDSSAVVRMSTVNGPVTIRSASDKRR
jgi:DUF4097 and DUF4098 domain-containing protein YvlB